MTLLTTLAYKEEREKRRAGKEWKETMGEKT
jgi:hypothetical protein